MNQLIKTISSCVCILGLATACSKPTPNDFEPPGKTQWQPVGERTAGQTDYSIIPQPNSFHTMHGNINNTDHLWIAAAPMFELDWVAETDMYVPEGPTFDAQGNLYFSPLQPSENVSLVSLNGETGERRWTIPGEERNSGSGAILILNDPANAAESLIYHATYGRARAITTSGEILWETPTGLTYEPLGEGEKDATHSFGMNYHPQTDSVIGVTLDGHVFAMDRETGEARNILVQLPGAATPPSDERPADWILNLGDKATNAAFGPLGDGSGLFSRLVDVLFGGGGKVTNYFGIDANTGNIYIAATAPDGDDGTIDDVSQLGALYLLSLADNSGTFILTIENYATFEGGTGSTPSISADGQRVIVSDSANNVIALDANLNELWRLDLGEQLAASVAISPDNQELYAVSRKNIFKIIDHGNHGEIDWIADLDAWSSDTEFNALTPTITANGVVVSVATGINFQGQEMMQGVGMGLLDRVTGRLRYFAPGREESISISSLSPSGDIYTANSPVRRAVTVGLLPKSTDPLIGGITKYKTIRYDLLVRDAVCAAEKRLQNFMSWYDLPSASSTDERLHIQTLLQQADSAISNAVVESSLSIERAESLEQDISVALDGLSNIELAASYSAALKACELFD